MSDIDRPPPQYDATNRWWTWTVRHRDGSTTSGIAATEAHAIAIAAREARAAGNDEDDACHRPEAG